MLTTDVEGVLVGIGAVGSVAVDAGTRSSEIVEDGGLVECRQVALVYPHVAVDLITGSYPTVCQTPVADGVRADGHRKVLILSPLAILLHADGKCQRTALVLPGERMPVVEVELCIVAVGVDLAALRPFHRHVDTVAIVAGNVEVHRSNAVGDGNAGVVGEDGRQFVDLRHILRFLGTRGEHHCRHHIDIYLLHINKLPLILSLFLWLSACL